MHNKCDWQLRSETSKHVLVQEKYNEIIFIALLRENFYYFVASNIFIEFKLLEESSTKWILVFFEECFFMEIKTIYLKQAFKLSSTIFQNALYLLISFNEMKFSS